MRIIDATSEFDKPLPNEKHEIFVREFIRLELEENHIAIKVRRIKAYVKAYPECLGHSTTLVEICAKTLVESDRVRFRIEHLLNEVDSSLEEKLVWTKRRSIKSLVSIVNNSEKDSDKIKAIVLLNEMKEVKEEEAKDSDVDTVKDFFTKQGV